VQFFFMLALTSGVGKATTMIAFLHGVFLDKLSRE
jgi:hypothetical protein